MLNYYVKQNCFRLFTGLTVRDPPRANGWLPARCPPSSEPGGNTGEIKAARKETGHPTSKADGSGQVSSLTGTPQCTDRIWDLHLPFLL